MADPENTTEFLSGSRNAQVRHLRRLLQSNRITHLAGLPIGLTRDERDAEVRRLRALVHTESGRFRLAVPSEVPHQQGVRVAADPILAKNGALTVALRVSTVNAVYCLLWILPPGATAWQNEREIANGDGLPDQVQYDVVSGTSLGWTIAIGGIANSAYSVALDLLQSGSEIVNGYITIKGTLDAMGQDSRSDSVPLQSAP